MGFWNCGGHKRGTGELDTAFLVLRSITDTLSKLASNELTKITRRTNHELVYLGLKQGPESGSCPQAAQPPSFLFSCPILSPQDPRTMPPPCPHLLPSPALYWGQVGRVNKMRLRMQWSLAQPGLPRFCRHGWFLSGMNEATVGHVCFTQRKKTH